ncbi:MAG: endonuclease domain-containing protein [Chitinophagaceae bacterium]|nr:endonuclease domain-containing protein [Chitinophagaceae bacterium]
MNREIIPYSPHLKELAKKLRKCMTFSEVKLWMHLNKFQMMGYDFDRQRPMLHYIVDFYCKDLKLVIEVDGITHFDENVVAKDRVRDDDLVAYGITVIRLNALDVVDNTNHALQIIANWILDYEKKNGVLDHVLIKRKGSPTPP